jgi:hypothetical protein
MQRPVGWCEASNLDSISVARVTDCYECAERARVLSLAANREAGSSLASRESGFLQIDGADRCIQFVRRLISSPLQLLVLRNSQPSSVFTLAFRQPPRIPKIICNCPPDSDPRRFFHSSRFSLCYVSAYGPALPLLFSNPTTRQDCVFLLCFHDSHVPSHARVIGDRWRPEYPSWPLCFCSETMKASNLLGLPATLLLLLGCTHGIQLPYNPTRIFLSPQNNRVAYILRPASASNSQCSLSSLDLSSRLTSSNLPYTTLFPTLPFLDETLSNPVNAVIDGGGNITIYTGTCSTGAAPSLWRLNPQGRAAEVGSWTQQTLTQSGVTVTQADALIGSNFLAASVAFSSIISASEQNSKMYFFGGMCPLASSTPDSWMSAANYSSSMLSYSPKAGTSSIAYNEALAAVRIRPIAQAGHSITALEPTFSNRTDGTQTQQQDFVLLGGHTQNAFLNMSQVALFSLPQEAWTYFAVMQPSASGRTDLAIRDNSVPVDPRSGHTAILSSDGKKIILFGGWVGDVNTPANPQLAVLNVGSGYGGQNDWSWTIPSSPSGPGLASNGGIYGHGAMVLPGNIMLVLGGYSIAAPSKSRLRRAATSQTLNAQAYFYNISSNTWLSDYTAPDLTGEGLTPDGPLSTASQRAGLGAGLGVGSVAVLLLLTFYLWYKRQLKQRQDEQERDIRNLTFASNRYGSDEWGMPASNDRLHANVAAMGLFTERPKPDPQPSQAPYPVVQPGQPGWRGPSAQEAERTGLLVEIPSPTRGLRRHVPGRSPYPYEKRGSRHMENIHPITERDEEDPMAAAAGASEMTARSAAMQANSYAMLVNAPPFDPFSDRRDPLSSHPVHAEASLQTGRTTADREQELQGWVSDWERAADALMSAPEMASKSLHPIHTGRVSPLKSSERTSSTLSDQSTSSAALSYLSTSGGGVTGLARSLSTRSAAFLNSLTGSFGHPGNISPTSDKSQQPLTDARSSLPSQQARLSRGASYSFAATTMATQTTHPTASTASTSPRRYEEDLYSPVRTSFAHLQAEGEALLGSYRPAPHSRNRSEPFSREKKGISWVGSMKRAISGAYGDRSASLAHSSSQYDASSSSSPTRTSAPPAPRRAVTDAEFLKGRRGARDWYTDDPEEIRHSFSEMETSRGVISDEAEDDEDDWDVERAAEGRVVQLMFTVPKQRLRVINTDSRSLISCDDIERPGKEKEMGGTAYGKEMSG